MTGWQGDDGSGSWDQQRDRYAPSHSTAPVHPGGFDAPRAPGGPSKLPAILSIIAIVVIVGTVITIVLVNRNGGTPDPTAAPTSSAAPSRKPSGPPSTRPSTTRSSLPSTGPADGRTIENAAARLDYRVPADWQPEPAAKVKVLDVDFTGAAVYGAYQCGGKGYTRTFAVSAAVQNTKDKVLDPEQTATTFAKAFAANFYPSSQLGAPTARASEIGGKKAVLVSAKVTPNPTKPDCEASAGEVAVLAVDLDNATADNPSGIALLVVTNDLGGGPPSPKVLPESTVQSVLSSARVR
ncbi:hypothetical protein [Actinokineospora sp.]|uniref:hypothetical protein n=1 Tax=Actinokineospora sp. TaxID=1872133 RepID=UPI0040379EDD